MSFKIEIRSDTLFRIYNLIYIETYVWWFIIVTVVSNCYSHHLSKISVKFFIYKSFPFF